MKKFVAIIATAVMSISAFAQVDTVETSYGRKLNDNFNLRYTDADKVHTEISVGAHVSGGDGEYTAEGIDISLRRQYKVASYGVQVSSEYSSEFGMSNSAAIMGGVRFGKSVSFGIDALSGYGQTHEIVNSSNPANGDTHEYKTSAWKPFVGAQASINFKLSKSVMLSVYGGYKHSFVTNGDHSLEMKDGWQVDGQTNDANRWFAGAAVSFMLNGEHQISGDNCWTGEGFGGYSNKGAVVGAKALHFKRTGAKIGRTLGFGTEYTIDDQTTNEVFGQAGLRFLPQGAKSPIVFDFYATVGVGQYAKTVEGSTEDASKFYMGSQMYAFGGSAKAHAGVSYHSGRFSIGAEAFAGGYVSAGTNFEGNFGYSGKTSGTSGAVYGGIVKVGFSF